MDASSDRITLGPLEPIFLRMADVFTETEGTSAEQNQSWYAWVKINDPSVWPQTMENMNNPKIPNDENPTVSKIYIFGFHKNGTFNCWEFPNIEMFKIVVFLIVRVVWQVLRPLENGENLRNQLESMFYAFCKKWKMCLEDVL